jgi:hypothetical protein
MATFNKFNIFVADVANKQHNLGSDALKVMLTNTAPAAANATTADITEISAGNGYTAGGSAVGISSSSQTSGLYKLIASSNTVFTASGGSIANFRYVVIYNSVNSKLVGWWDSGSTVSVASGNTFTVQYDGTNGILNLQ